MTSHVTANGSLVIDDIDCRIINLLCVDARISLSEIARSVHLSRAAVHARFARLQKIGVVRGSTLLVDYEKIAHTVSAVLLVGCTTATTPKLSKA